MPFFFGPPGTPTDGPPSVGWLSPAMVLALASDTTRDIVIPAGSAVQFLSADPQRAAFLILKNQASTNFPRVGPTPDVATYGLRESASQDLLTVVLQDWLGLVTREWWAFSAAGATIRVWEFRTPTFGQNNVRPGHSNSPPADVPSHPGTCG